LVSVVALFPGVYRRVSADILFKEAVGITAITAGIVAIVALFSLVRSPISAQRTAGAERLVCDTNAVAALLPEQDSIHAQEKLIAFAASGAAFGTLCISRIGQERAASQAQHRGNQHPH
jgi:hypothetical protein